MLLSFYQKSRNLLGIGEKNSALSSPTDEQPSTTSSPLGSRVMEFDDDPKHLKEFQELVYDYIRNIKDPEKPATLEDLHVVYEDGIQVRGTTPGNLKIVRIEFNPTVPHCTLATLIGLCIRVRLERTIAHSDHFKLDIYIKKGTHNTEEDINKQINDKERVAAAMENPNIRKVVEDCISEED